MNTKNICSLCAWRAECLKKFSLSGKDIRCPDFVKDIALKNEEKDPEPKQGE